MRAVLDPNSLVSALLLRTGAPGRIVAKWRAGEFELVVSELLLAELERALAYPKLRKRIAADDAAAFVDLLRTTADIAVDRPETRWESPDPGDDYLLSLAEGEPAMLVSGDAHLLGLAAQLPIRSPRAFLEMLEAESA